MGFIDKIRTNSLAKDSFWAVFGNGLGNALLLLAGIFIARLLGKDLYGEYGVVKTTMFYSAAFATFGLGITSTKFLADYLQRQRALVVAVARDATRITLAFSAIIALLLYAAAPQLAAYMHHSGLALSFRMLSGIIILRALLTTQQGILSGLHAFRAVGINAILSGLSLLLACVPMTFYWGLRGSLMALLLAQVVGCLLNYRSIRILLRQVAQDCPQTEEPVIGRLLSFSFPIALQESSFTICSGLGIMLLTRYATVGDVGIFTASLQWNVIIMLIPTLLTNVVLAHLSATAHNTAAHNVTMRRLLLINIVCATLPFLIIYPCCGWIASVYGSQFSGMTSVLQILLFDALLFSITTVFKSEYISRGHNWLLFTVRLIKDISLVAIAYYALQAQWSLSGAQVYAIAYIASSVLYLSLILIGYLWIEHHSSLSEQA